MARETVRFVLDGESRILEGGDPTQTVLDYLRGVEKRCGTKEGCAEGDCGACTVVIGELGDDGMRYRAVNSCVMFVPMLDGRELITVESLADTQGTLHPVQQAMVDFHGSQCGFCTPGFVMSLYGLWLTGQPVDRDQVNDAIAGNLCRCTGYRPIVDAALIACSAPHTVPDAAASLLAGIRPEGTLSYGEGTRRFFAPTTVEDCAELYRTHPDARLVAGGTDVGLWVNKQFRHIETVIYLGQVPELNRIATVDGCLTIGAAAPHADALEMLAAFEPDLGPLMRRFGSAQIRNSGTMGGNIANASPIGDTPPALLALDATLVLRCGDTERMMPIDQFFLGYRKTALAKGEFITRILIPPAQADRQFRCYKISKRIDQDISAVCGAFVIRLDAGRVTDIRLAFGGMAERPKRAAKAEAVLLGSDWNEAAVATAVAALAQDFQPLSDQRASSAYRLLVAGNLLRKFHLETSGARGPTRVHQVAELV
jgi:xanthine dehydrogenase small subunit